MGKTHAVIANGTQFAAKSGDVILDAALRSGIQYPHDCRAGRCGSCLTRVLKGVTFGGESFQRGTVHACMARVLTDVELAFDKLPPVDNIRGEVASVERRGIDVCEVGLSLSQPLHFYPGQYCRFKFRGFPARSFSPTWPANGTRRVHDITLHVKQVRGGLVSNALGGTITTGHRVEVEGPFGAAFYRDESAARLVLVAGGTGFAPILSIAMAALGDDPLRNIEFVIGTRTIKQLYMAPGLLALKRYPGISFTITANEVPDHISVVRQGGPADYLPELLASDAVYAAGSPAMVTRIAEAAEIAGASFCADPFSEGPVAESYWVQQLAKLRAGRGANRRGGPHSGGAG